MGPGVLCQQILSHLKQRRPGSFHGTVFHAMHDLRLPLLAPHPRKGQELHSRLAGLPQVVGNCIQLVHVLFLAHGEGLLSKVRPHHIQSHQHLAWYVAPHY